MSEQESKPKAAPLDAEREKLRAAGYTDAEISQILIARAAGGNAAAHAGTGGAMSSVLGSLIAVAGYIGNLLFGFRADAATLFDPSAKAGARVGASIGLVVKLVVMAVLGFGAWQEWRQHIISAPQTAANNSELTEAQAAKAKAEAVYAEELAKGEKAKACAARMDLLTKNMGIEDFSDDGKHIKSGSRTANMMEEYEKDCDPTYAARAKGCAERFTILVDQIGTIPFSDFLDKFKSHAQQCTITDEQRAEATRKTEEADAKRKERIKDSEPQFKQSAIEAAAAVTEQKAGHYEAAYAHAQAFLKIIEPVDIQVNFKAGKVTAAAYILNAWYGVFARKFAEVVTYADRAVEIEPPALQALTNKAHALMFLRREDDAKALYLAHRGEVVDKDRKWEKAITDDFAELRKAGLSNPLMKEIETAFAPPPPVAPPATQPQQVDPPAKDEADLPSRASALRTPTLFNCDKATLGSDYVICASAELMDAEARLEDAYIAARDQRGDGVKLEQRAWIKRFGPDCGLEYRGRPDDMTIHAAAPCIGRALESRITELQGQN